MDLDVYPVTVRGDLATTNSRLVTFARLIIHEGRLFVAEGRQRGAVVSSVREYPAPEGEWERNPRKTKAGSWGEWRWDGCGCGSSWNRHSIEDLIAQAIPLETDSLPSAESDPEPDTEVGDTPPHDGSESPDLISAEG